MERDNYPNKIGTVKKGKVENILDGQSAVSIISKRP